MITGLILCAAVALLSMWVGGLQRVFGAPIVGLFLGILIANIASKSFLKSTSKGAAFSTKQLLRLGIIIAGGTLSFRAIISTGGEALPYIVFSMLVAFSAAFLIGKLMKVSGNSRVLVGGGTAICGGNAIATLSAIIEAKEEETAYAMTAIFLFDIFAALILPYAAVAMAFSPDQFGMLAGVAINNVASVTAAGETFNTVMGDAAVNAAGTSGGDLAMIIKLTRVTLLVVVAVIATVAYQMQKQKSAQGDNLPASKGSTSKNIIKAFPYYVLGFLLLAILNTAVDFSSVALFGTNLSVLFTTAFRFLITMALVGIGCKIKLSELFTKGAKPVLLGGCTWVAVMICALIYTGVFLS